MTTTRPYLAARIAVPICALSLALAAIAPLDARQTKVIGTFTVEGKTTTWKQIYMSRHQDLERPSQHFLILLVADRPVAEADREPTRLQELAQDGQVRAIRMVWHEGFDGITTTPFHKDATDSGTVTRGGAIIDLTRYDERELEAQFKSKMLGQNWHFNAFFKGRLTQGPPMEAVEFDAPAPTTKAVTGTDLTSLKRRVGAMGFEWTDEGFMQAVKDAKAEAVALFLQGGQSPNTKDSQGLAALLFASMYCDRDASAYGEILGALLKAGADPNVKDENNSTALIWAAQSCAPEVLDALIKAGADVNAKAKGGASALMMADVLQRTQNVAVLKKAGAKPWK